MQIDTEVKVQDYRELIYARSITIVHVLVESTQPRRYVEQGPHRLVCERRSGPRRRIATYQFGLFHDRPVL